MAFYLAFKEIWRNRGRFLLFSMVVALITMLVLFIAGLAAGLSAANREYLSNLDAQLIVYQENSDYLINASRLAMDKAPDLRRLPGVAEVGAIALTNASIWPAAGDQAYDITLIGVEPGKPGEPALIDGRGLRGTRSREAIIDSRIAKKFGLQPGDAITVKSTQGTREEFFPLTVSGVADRQYYQFLPSVIVPYRTWERIRPQEVAPQSEAEFIPNIFAVKVQSPDDVVPVQASILSVVPEVLVADVETAIESIPGYSVQQSTLNTQRFFTLLIGVLVLGGFFQIQTLQKIGQIGMLKAIGAANKTVAGASLWQIAIVTSLGVALGGLVTFLLAIGIPPEVPLQLTGATIATTTLLLLIIGPLAGMVSIRLAVRVDPLTAIGQ
ncbi:MAG: ABC transporter permease [Anaerolineales bacterium]|nr:ABC transporter permease [Anaerolineales bacterium]